MFIPLNAGEFDHLECLCLLLDMMKIDPIYSSVTHRYVQSPVGGGGELSYSSVLCKTQIVNTSTITLKGKQRPPNQLPSPLHSNAPAPALLKYLDVLKHYSMHVLYTHNEIFVISSYSLLGMYGDYILDLYNILAFKPLLTAL